MGATLFPVNWRLTSGELQFVIEDVDPVLVLWQQTEIGDRIAAARDVTSNRAQWIQVDSDFEWQRFIDAHPDLLVDVQRGSTDQPPLAIYTSAFSGTPAAALLTSEALLLQASVMSTARAIDHEAVILNVGPMFHMGVWLALLPTWLKGGVNVIVRRSDPVELCRLVQEEKCTHAYLVSATQEQIVDANQDGQFDLSTLRSSEGSEAWQAMVTADDSPWATNPGVYGQTETTGVVAFKMIGPPSLGNAGWPSPFAELMVVDEAGAELPPGEIGEISVGGPMVMQGYFRRPDRNRAEFRNGWRLTNDLGVRETDGSLTFVGPKMRMVKSGRENIYPVEVERALNAHPDVLECAVIGVPDPQWVQRVKAVVVRSESSDLSAEDLIAHCRSLIAGYKIPRDVEFTTNLPRDGMSLDYGAIDARHGGGGYPGLGHGPLKATPPTR